MRWIRSWPAVIPAGRAYVQDDLERLVLADYDYTPLGAIDDDVIVLEWDMAVSHEDRLAFEAICRDAPAQVHVAPYRLYLRYRAPCWAHRRVNAAGVEAWVDEGEAVCDYFSFGLTYLPHALIDQFLAAPAPERGRPPFLPLNRLTDCRFHDQTFSVWHRWHGPQTRVPIAWDVRPVHLHYDLT